MTSDTTEIPPRDHNKPPPYDAGYIEKTSGKIRDRADQAGEWLDKGAVDNDVDAGRLKDFRDGIKKMIKEIDNKRAADKRPILDAGKDVDAAYKALAGPLERLVKRLNPILTAFADKKATAEDAARLAEMKRLEDERVAVEAAARAAENRNDVIGEEEAAKQKAVVESTMKDIARAKSMGRIESASGGGKASSLRTHRYVKEITSFGLAVSSLLKMGYQRNMEDLIERLANAEIRKKDGAREIPGIEIGERKELV